MNKPIHILRYGTVAEKVHLEKAITAYDYLSINGNSAAYVSNAISKFIVEKFFSKPQKGYFIDPITYAFQDHIELLWKETEDRGKFIRKSVDKLISIYDYPASKARKCEEISVDDFDSQTIKEFCSRVLSFQYDLVYEYIKSNGLQKYLDYISHENVPQLRPKFLIPPYFYLDSKQSDWSRWLNINKKMLERAVESSADYGNTPIYGQLVLSRAILNDYSAIEAIVEAYGSARCSGFTIWIDDLKESQATLEELEGYLCLLQKLKEKGRKPILDMYGGYFSILLTHKNVGLLDGVSHGLEYGESRQVYPVGGGVPVSKYYYFPVHQRMDFTDALYLLEYAKVVEFEKPDWGSSKRYFSEICMCNQCKRVVNEKMINFLNFESKEFYTYKRKDSMMRRKKASSDTRQNCLYHYLLCKKKEFDMLSKFPIEELVEELRHQFMFYKGCKLIKKNELNCLDVWYEVLKNRVN